MARLQRKRPTSLKKKKSSEAAGAELTGASNESSSAEAPAAPPAPAVKKAPAAFPRRAPSAPRSREVSEPGKIRRTYDQVVQFLREVKVELKKVAWPSRKQTIGSTVVVLTLVFIIATFLGLVDMGLAGLVRLVLQ
jgi:preprotein translocase subunit SecE